MLSVMSKLPMLGVFMLNVVMITVVMITVVMLTVVVPFFQVSLTF
jgi:hypothetical protein